MHSIFYNDVCYKAINKMYRKISVWLNEFNELIKGYFKISVSIQCAWIFIQFTGCKGIVN